MNRLPELPADAVAEYWQLVRAALMAGGMSKAEATAAAKAYRAFMKPAGWALYNTDPEESAKYATKYVAWMRKQEQQEGTKPKAAPKRVKPPRNNADRLPTEKRIDRLPRWARLAFGARCARRVAPLFQRNWPVAPQEHSLAVWRAVQLAEESASLTVQDFDLSSAARAAAGASSGADKHSAFTAASAAYAAFSAIDNRSVDAMDATIDAIGPWAKPIIRKDFQRVVDQIEKQAGTDATPVPPAVFGPLWPESPPADWPELPKPAKLKLSVQVPDGVDDAAAREKLQKLITALARLNIVGGGHGLELVRPIVFTQEQERGRADVVEQEGKKAKGRGHSQGGR